MRKGLIVIFTRNKKIASDCFNYIKNKLNKINIDRQMEFSRTIIINDYEIHIIEDIKGYPRGHRPEIMYILNESDRNTNEKYIEAWKDAKIKTYLHSTRKEPVRYIKNFTEIDLQEIEDDDYTLNEKCDSNRIKEWNKIIERGNRKDEK